MEQIVEFLKELKNTCNNAGSHCANCAMKWHSDETVNHLNCPFRNDLPEDWDIDRIIRVFERSGEFGKGD